MTARHTSTRRGGRGGGRAVARRLGALLSLLLIITGPPTLLLLLAGNPLDPPAALRTRQVLTSPVDDRTLLWLLAALAWAVYTHLLACLLIEALRQTRGSTLRVPLGGLLFGANTALAGHLIAGLLLTSHVATAGGTLTPAMLHTALTSPAVTATTSPLTTASPATGAFTATPSAALSALFAASGAAPATTLIECRVLPPDGRDHDTLWDIAERHLGDGTRWREIFALNDNRLMPDGQRLSKASLIYPGWILTLPADAITLDIDRVAPTPTAPPAAPPPPTPPRTLQLPDPAAPTPQLPTTETPQGSAEAAETPSESQPQADGSTADHPAPAAPRTALLLPGQVPGTAAPTAAPHDPTLRQDTDQPSDAGANQNAVAPAALGTLALASLGVLTALTRRRKVAARRRPPGVRTQRPSAELLEQEQRLRTDARRAEDTAATVRLALLLTANSSNGAALKALWQHPDGSLELCWTEPAPCTPVPAPFQPTDTGWLLPADAHRLLYATRQPSGRPQTRDAALTRELARTPDPVPLLVPVGHRNGSALLVNLEQYGAVTLRDSSPDGELALPVLTAVVHALASAPWASAVHIIVPERLAEVATGFERISSTDQITPPVTLLPEEQLQIASLGSVAAARQANPDLHDEALTVYAGHRPDQIPGSVFTAAAARQHPVVLLLLDLADPTDTSRSGHTWTLTRDGILTIPGLADDLTPLRLDADSHQRILRLLEHAQDPPHAAPDDPDRVLLRELCPPDPTALEPTALEPTALEPTALEPTALEPTALESIALEPIAVATDDEPAAPQDTGPGDGGSAPPEGQPHPEPGQEPATPAGTKTVGVAQRSSTGPVEVGVLGPVTITGLDADPPRRVTTDLLVYLAFHRRPLTSLEMWNGLWPHKPYQDTTLRSRRSELNRFIHPLLCKRTGNRFQLDDLLHTDWQRFQALADGNPDQQLAALALVRGRPFDNCQHDWMHLEGLLAEIEAAITDLALHVGQRALTRNDFDTARTAAHAGLKAIPFDERLYRLAMQAAAAQGATGEVQQLRRQLSVVLQDELEPDDEMQPATAQLLQNLADAQRSEQLPQPPRDHHSP